MSPDLRRLSPQDMDDLKVDPDGNLYWSGRKVRTTGWSKDWAEGWNRAWGRVWAGGWTKDWTTTDRIALTAAIISVLALLIGFVKDYSGIREGWEKLTGTEKPSPPAATSSATPAAAVAPDEGPVQARP